MAQTALRIMTAQGTFGCLLFNTSKPGGQSGRGFRAYGLPKAATCSWSSNMRWITAKTASAPNAVNADRDPQRTSTEEMVAARSRRGDCRRPTIIWPAICSSAGSHRGGCGGRFCLSGDGDQNHGGGGHCRWRQYRSEFALVVMARECGPRTLKLIGEPEAHHVAVLHDIFLAFQPDTAGFAGAGFALAGDIIGIGDGFGADEALFEIGVDDAGALRRA